MSRKVKPPKKGSAASKGATTKKKKNIFKNKPKFSIPAPLGKGGLEHLIANPCYGPLERAATIGGIVERVRAVNGVQTLANGYIIWFPSYHGNDVQNSFANLFLFQNSLTATGPTNTPAAGIGTGSTAGTGIFITDPAYANLTSGTFSRARSLAACITAQYTGALSAVQGEIAYISNCRVSDIVGNNMANPTYPTIDQLFAYSRTVMRASVDPMEVVWRPTDATSKFRATNATAIADTALARDEVQPKPDVFWQKGDPTAISQNRTVVACTDPSDAVGIVFMWRGFSNTANTLTFRFTKVVELELAPSGNAIEQMVTTKTVPLTIDKAVAKLDRSSSLWQTPGLNHAVNGVIDYLAPPMVAPFAKAVYSGITQMIG